MSTRNQKKCDYGDDLYCDVNIDGGTSSKSENSSDESEQEQSDHTSSTPEYTSKKIYCTYDKNEYPFPNKSFCVDSLIHLRINGYDFVDKEYAQAVFDDGLSDVYNGVILFPHLKTAIIFPVGMFHRSLLPDYEYKFGHIKCCLFIARCDETPNFIRKCLYYEDESTIITTIHDCYTNSNY
jgi:hypothetical protein